MNARTGRPRRGGEGWVAILWGLITTCAWATAAGQVSATEDGGSHGQTYVILTDLPQEDPYYVAVTRLQQYRAARIVPFRGSCLGAELQSVRELGPQFVAIVVRPHTIDINFAYDVLEFSSRLDEDPFPDFAYGFITGATADDAVGFVDNIIRAERERDSFPLSIVAFGPSGVSQVDDDSKFDWAGKWQQVRLKHKPGDLPEMRLAELASSGVIRLWGHGTPGSVVDGISFRDIQHLDFFPAVVFAGPCFSAVTARSFVYDPWEAVVKVRKTELDMSLALTFISRGISGYFGALAEDLCLSAGQEMEHALTTGLPLGMTAKYTYDSVVMGGGGEPVSFGRFCPGRWPPTPDAIEAKLQFAASRILLGDPAYQPFAKAADPPWRATLQQAGDGLDIVATLDDPRIRCVLVDPFRADLCDCGIRNDRLYLVVELPLSLGPVESVSFRGSDDDSAEMRHGGVQWIEERWLGKRLLHLQIDFRHGSLDEEAKGATLVFHVHEARARSQAGAVD